MNHARHESIQVFRVRVRASRSCPFAAIIIDMNWLNIMKIIIIIIYNTGLRNGSQLYEFFILFFATIHSHAACYILYHRY